MNRVSYLSKLVLGLGALGLLGCEKGNRSYSLLSEVNTFQQTTAAQTKVDVLWMVDGSGTMANHQTNLASNFENFIQQFVDKGFDFNIVVASTDAWVRELNYNAGTCTASPNPLLDPLTIYKSSFDCKNTRATFADLTHFRDGDIYGTAAGAAGLRSGQPLITSAMPRDAILSTFATNVKTGVRGDGAREAGFQSLRAVLRRNEFGSESYGGETHTALNSFRRPDAFFAVIMVSDEEDQSRRADDQLYASTEEYTSAFLNFMDGYTQSAAKNRKYNVSGIVLEDLNNCGYGLHPQATQGDRYKSIAQATRGVIGSICSPDFSAQLGGISERIVTLATRFPINRAPIPSSIRVWVNGTAIPESATEGWTYYFGGEDAHFIEFHGEAIPAEGASIAIDFDPVAPKD